VKHLRVLILVCLGSGLCAGCASAAAGEASGAAMPAAKISYTKENAPATPKLEDLPLRASICQYGITWTFAEAARVGRFVNGDYYVVGPVTVKAINPAPEAGRNGSTLNIPITRGIAESKVGFDDRVPHGRYDPKLFQKPPLAMKPGDVLFSSISLKRIGPIRPMCPRSRSHMSKEHSPIRTVAVLTCLAKAVPPDAFRPGYADPKRTVYLARNLRRDRLPKLRSPGEMPKLTEWERMFERPWIDIVMDEFSAPIENMPIYGQEFTRATSIATLLLAVNFKPAEKEVLLVRFVQVGIDTWSLLRAGKCGWPALGGHGNGRKWVIIFTGLMLDDAGMKQPNKTFPKALFSEDMQTMFGPSWTGARVVYAGHLGKQGSRRHIGWGAYEHLHPSKWESDIGESYRRCCTSMCWVGEALAVQLYGAEKLWDHDAFLVYADRWMYEDDMEAIRVVKEVRGKDYDNDWSRQGMVWDPFVKAMWEKYRPTLAAPTDRWKQAPGGKD